MNGSCDSPRQVGWRVVLLMIHRREIESLRNDQGPDYLSFTGQGCNFSLEYSVLHPRDRSLLELYTIHYGLITANSSCVGVVAGHCDTAPVYISRSEQAPGSGFHPRGKSDKIDCELLGPSWCNKKVDPER